MANKNGGLGGIFNKVAKSISKAFNVTKKKKKKAPVVKATNAPKKRTTDPRAKTENIRSSGASSSISKAVSNAKKSSQSAAQKAYQNKTNANQNALGAKTQTRKSGSKNTLASNLDKVATRTATVGQAKKELDTNKDYKGLSKAQKKQVLRDYVRSQDWKSIDKEIDKSHDTRVSSKDLNMEDYLRIGNATRMPNQKTMVGALGDSADKVAARNAYDYGKGGASAFAQEFMNSSSVSPVNLTDGYNYTQAQRNAIQQGRESKAGKFGYMAGIGASAVFGGVTGMEGAMGKVLYKEGGKSAVKRFMADRGADLIINSGINSLDAARSSVNEDGKIDLGEAGKRMLQNELLDLGFGSVMGGASVGLKKLQVKKALVLKTKLEKGIPLDASEVKLMNKINQRTLDDEYEFVNEANKQTQKASKDRAYLDSLKEDKAKFDSDVNARKKGVDVRNHIREMKAEEPKAKAEVPKKDEVDPNRPDARKDYEDLKAEYKRHNAEGIQSFEEYKKWHDENILKPYEKAKAQETAPKTDTNVSRYEELNTKKKDIEDQLAEIDRKMDAQEGDPNKLWEETNKLEDELSAVEDEMGKTFKNEKEYLKAKEAEAKAVIEESSRLASELNKADIKPKLEVKEEPKTEPKVEPKVEKNAEPDKEWVDMSKTERTKALDKKIYDRYKDTKPVQDIVGEIQKAFKSAEDWDKYLSKNNNFSASAKRLAKWAIDTFEDSDKAFDFMKDLEKAGGLDKKGYKAMTKAVEDADKLVAKGIDDSYENLMKVKSTEDGVIKYDPYAFKAELDATMNALGRRFRETGNLDDLEKLNNLATRVIQHNSDMGHGLNACKLVLRASPEGRLQLASAELKRLNKKFADRLDEELKLTDDEVKKVLEAESDEAIDKAFKEINDRLWDNIPSTAWEKFNEWRHLTMLANPKTHIRNLVGNGVFAIARTMSNCIEIGLAKGVSKVSKKDLKLTMSKAVSTKDLRTNKEFLDKQWDEWYSNTDSKNRYIETNRPDGKTEIRFKPVSKAVQLNYKALEKEDMLALRPAYKRAFMRYCKSHDIKLDGTAKKSDLEKASIYAGEQAQYATYRDNSALSDMLVGLKRKTAGKQGKNLLGTGAYRAGNMVLESTLPFVKTPVNVARRMLDYSPMGIIRSAADLAQYAKKGDVDRLADSIHYMATGLTGSGVMVLGAWLAHNGLLMTKAGSVSGDEYYDRDMGYQDYSLVLPDGTPFFGGKSYTLDWVAPMATSLFMGASTYESLFDGGFEFQDIIDGLGAMTNPMLEMSFMSSSKDMVEMFMENAIDRETGETHWADAVFNMIGGSIPQGYLSSMFTSQIVGQVAAGSDMYQRDTSSTRANPMGKSWESWMRKNINKMPWLREKMLNKKVDRQGNDVRTVGGDNVVTRLTNAIFNPSTTKNITFNDTDREIIKIYKGMPTETNAEKKNKQYFFYNFTGNPSYDLADGGRMSYKDKYTYTKENRQQQNRLINQMIRDEGYKAMTPKMKADEVGDAHWISTAVADRKTYGDKYAAKAILKNGSDNDKEAWTANKASGGSAKDFVDFHILKETTIAQTHDTSYYTKAIAVAEYDKWHKGGGKAMAMAYDIYDAKVKNAVEYMENGGSVKEYTTALRRVMAGIDKEGASNSQKNKAVSAGTYEVGTVNGRTYKAMGLSGDDANMGIGLSQKFETKYSLSQLTQMKADMKMNFNKDENSSINKEEVAAYVDSLGITNQAEKACLFAYLYQYSSKKNPFGAIPNYSNSDDTSSGGGGGRRGHRRGHHRGGGGGGKGGEGSYEKWLKAHGYGTGGSSGYKSNLNEAFRKRQLKNLQATSGRMTSK